MPDVVLLLQCHVCTALHPSVTHLHDRQPALSRLLARAGGRNSPPLAIFFTFSAEVSSSSRIATLFYWCHKTYLVGWFGKQTPPQNMEYQMPQSRGGRKGRRGECFLAALMYKFIGAARKIGHRTSYTIKKRTNTVRFTCPLPKVKDCNSSFQHTFLIQAHQPRYFASKCANP